MKIAIHTVCKNERDEVDAWVENAKDADVIMPVDTGSTDGTWELIQTHSVSNPRVLARRIAIRPWRFDFARNAALAALPEDVDVTITMDMDERLDVGWRDAVERIWRPGITTQAFYRYIFAQKDDGTPILQFNQCRMFSRHGFLWQLPAHEAPHFYDWTRENSVVMVPHMTMRQKQNLSKDRMGRDLELCELGYRENPNSQRALFYYARQLYYAGRPQETIDLLNKYFANGRTFPWEAAAAADCLAQAWRAIGGTM